MTIAELTTYRVPEDLASPVLVEGYVVSFATFYERGVSVPSHRFLCTLPQYYDLELHNLTPPGVLHITTFVTLCEAFMGIDPFSTYGTTSSRPVLAGPGRGNDCFGGCNYPCEVWAWRRPLFQHPHAQIHEWVREVIELLRQEGLTVVHLMQTFFSHRFRCSNNG
jgi:hypothetical protein